MSPPAFDRSFGCIHGLPEILHAQTCLMTAVSHLFATRLKALIGLMVLSLLVAMPLEAEEVATLNEQDVMALFFERNLALISGHYNIDRAEAETLMPAPFQTLCSASGSTNSALGPHGSSPRPTALRIRALWA